MSQLNPLAIAPVSVLMAAILVGGDQVQMKMRLPSAMGQVMQGMILFPMLAGSLFTEFRIRRSAPRAGGPAPGREGAA